MAEAEFSRMQATLALPVFSLSWPSAGAAVLRRDMTEADDTALMLQVATGDRRAYGQLVERHLRHAVKPAYRVLFNRADAEEIAQANRKSVVWGKRGEVR